MQTVDMASFWDEDQAWFWINEQVNRYELETYDSVETLVTRLENGSYRASVTLIQAQGELFE